MALTVYFAAQYMVLNYVRKMNSVAHWWSHLKQLWFANIANNILWWAYVKACFRVARAYYGRGLQFKSTAKGKGAIAAAAWNLFQDLGIPGACLILLIISLGELSGPSSRLFDCCRCTPCLSSANASCHVSRQQLCSDSPTECTCGRWSGLPLPLTLREMTAMQAHHVAA